MRIVLLVCIMVFTLISCYRADFQPKENDDVLSANNSSNQLKKTKELDARLLSNKKQAKQTIKNTITKQEIDNSFSSFGVDITSAESYSKPLVLAQPNIPVSVCGTVKLSGKLGKLLEQDLIEKFDLADVKQLKAWFALKPYPKNLMDDDLFALEVFNFQANFLASGLKLDNDFWQSTMATFDSDYLKNNYAKYNDDDFKEPDVISELLKKRILIYSQQLPYKYKTDINLLTRKVAQCVYGNIRALHLTLSLVNLDKYLKSKFNLEKFKANLPLVLEFAKYSTARLYKKTVLKLNKKNES